MIENETKPMALKSSEYYRSITSIDFKPIEVIDFSKKLAYRKGDTMIKKRLFRKPKVITVTEDLYKHDGDYINRKELLRHYWSKRYNEEKNFFYYPSEVKIRVNGYDHSYSFDTNEEAMAFIDDLKDKCKKCGNELL